MTPKAVTREQPVWSFQSTNLSDRPSPESLHSSCHPWDQTPQEGFLVHVCPLLTCFSHFFLLGFYQTHLSWNTICSSPGLGHSWPGTVFPTLSCGSVMPVHLFRIQMPQLPSLISRLSDVLASPLGSPSVLLISWISPSCHCFVPPTTKLCTLEAELVLSSLCLADYIYMVGGLNEWSKITKIHQEAPPESEPDLRLIQRDCENQLPFSV